MANNYTVASELFDLPPKALRFAEELYDTILKLLDAEGTLQNLANLPHYPYAEHVIEAGELRDEEWPGFEAEFDDARNRLWVYGEESINLDALGEYLSAVSRKYSLEPMTVTWADFCSKLRPSAFGGGALVVTRTGWRARGAYQVARDLLNEMVEEEDG